MHEEVAGSPGRPRSPTDRRKSLNPYRSPTAVDQDESWWTKLCRLFVVAAPLRTPVFADGDAIIFDGIAFFVDPKIPFVAYAASPSIEQSEKRMNLIVAEAIRILPAFLAEYPKLQSILRGRKLTVRMIENYNDVQSGFLREIALEWDILNAMLLHQRTTCPDG